MKVFEQHPHWPSVLKVCQTLNQHKFKAWLAGGCVRDAIRNVSPQDFDVATDATPDQVQKIFPKSVDVGKAFGVIVLPFEGFQVEVATFRRDGTYQDGRRPDKVEFSTPEEDAKRRDFTVNALFYDPVTKQIHDFVAGRQDLQAGLLRCVGKPEVRFGEDRLRILRGVRFAAQLGYKIDPPTYAAMKALSKTVAQVSEERVFDEMWKLLKSPQVSVGLKLLQETGLLAVTVPELAQLEPTFYWERTKKIFELIGDPKTDHEGVLFSLFLMHAYDTHRKNFSAGEALLKRWKVSNALKAEVVGFVKTFWEMSLHPTTLAQKRRAVAQYRQPFLMFLERTAVLYPVEKLVAELKTLPLELPPPFLTGEDLKNVGVPPGPLMGQLLLQAMDLQLEGLLNSKPRAESWLKRQIK